MLPYIPMPGLPTWLAHLAVFWGWCACCRQTSCSCAALLRLHSALYAPAVLTPPRCRLPSDMPVGDHSLQLWLMTLVNSSISTSDGSVIGTALTGLTLNIPYHSTMAIVAGLVLMLCLQSSSRGPSAADCGHDIEQIHTCMHEMHCFE